MILFYWSKAKEENKFRFNWELLKFEIGPFLRECGSQKAKSRRAVEDRIVSNITNLSSKDPEKLTEEEKEELASLQVKLDELYCQKAKGAFIRSPSKWFEEGEQNSHYFFNLEKLHSSNNNISKLNINEITTEDHHKISEYCSNFYKELYSSKFCQA